MTTKGLFIPNTDQMPYVAFAATVTAERAYNTRTPVIFDNVYLNAGGAYDGTSTFVCPQDGYYAFQVN